MKKAVVFLLVLAALFAVGCKHDDAKAINIVETDITVAVGKERTVECELKGISADDVEWSSSDRSVLTVDKGKITALALGKAVVTASFGDVSDSVNVSVIKESVTYFDMGLQSLTMQKGQVLPLNPFVYDDGEYKDVTAAYTVEGDAVKIEDGKITALKEGSSTVKATSVYNDKEYTDEKTVTVEAFKEYAALTTADGKDANINISLKAGVLLSDQMSVTVYKESGSEKYSLEFRESETLTVNGEQRTLNSRFALMKSGEKKGDVRIALYATGDDAFEDVIDEEGYINYTVPYNYGLIFDDLNLGEEKFDCFINDKMRVNVVPQNSLYDFASITTGKIKEDFSANSGTEASLSDTVTYRGASTLRFNTLGQWYPAISFDGVLNELKENYTDSEVTFTFKVYFDREYTDNIVFFCNFQRDSLIELGKVKPREWTDISIKLTAEELSSLDTMRFDIQMYSNDHITGADYSVYFADINLGAVVYNVKTLEFEKSAYTVSDTENIKVLINGVLCDATDARIVSSEYIFDKNIAYVKNGAIYAVRKGTATLTLKAGDIECSTSVTTENLPNGDYHFENAFGGTAADYFRIIGGNNGAASGTGLAYYQLANEDNYYDDGEGNKTPVLHYHEYATTWYQRYLALLGYNDGIEVGKYVKMVLKHDYRGNDPFEIRSYQKSNSTYEFFDAAKVEKKDGWITLYLRINNKPEDTEFYFQLIDSEAKAQIDTFIYSIETVDNLGQTENGLYSFGDMTETERAEKFGGKDLTSYSVEYDETYGAALRVALGTGVYNRGFIFKDLYNNATAGNYLHIAVKLDKVASLMKYYIKEITEADNFYPMNGVVAGEWYDLYIPIKSGFTEGDWVLNFFDDGLMSGSNYAGPNFLIGKVEIIDVSDLLSDIQSIAFEHESYAVSENTPIKILINGEVCAANDLRLTLAEYEFDNNNVVRVKDSVLYAERVGTATVTMKLGGKECSTTVTVSNLANGLYNFAGCNLGTHFPVTRGSSAVEDDDDYGKVLKITTNTDQPYTRPLHLNTISGMAQQNQYVHIRVKFDKIVGEIYSWAYTQGQNSFCSKQVNAQQGGTPDQEGQWLDFYYLISNTNPAVGWTIEFFDDGQKTGALYTGLTCYIAEINVVDSVPTV